MNGRAGAAAWIALAGLAGGAACGCLPRDKPTTTAPQSGVDRCGAVALPRMVVFERAPLDVGTWTFRATLQAVIPPPDSGLTDLVLAESGGGRRQVAFASPTGLPPVNEGESYAFRLDYVGGAPDATAIVIRDGEGLLYAAATDQRPGAAVLRDGLPGFTLSLLPAECGSRLESECYEAVRNLGLAVEHAGRRVVLFQGESAVLDDYRVDCLIAQEVTYSSRCADAGLPGVSYVITRLR